MVSEEEWIERHRAHNRKVQGQMARPGDMASDEEDVRVPMCGPPTDIDPNAVRALGFEPGEKSIQQLVIEDIQEREQYGIKTFGRAIFLDTPDDPEEGGPAEQAYTEALDLVIYLRWLKERLKALKDRGLI